MGHVHVVVLDEGDAPLEARIARGSPYPLQDVLRFVVRRVRLPREDELHGAVTVRQQAPEARFVAEEERRSLVGRKPAREADRERSWAQERTGADEVRGILPEHLPAIPGELATEAEQGRLELEVQVPDPRVVELQNL